MENAKKRIYAGFYKRFDGKIIYVITTAKDVETEEEKIIFLLYDYSSPVYFTCSRSWFLEPVQYQNKTVQKFRRQTQMYIDDAFIMFLNYKGFRSPLRKTDPKSYDTNERFYQHSHSYIEYAVDLCQHYRKDYRILRLCAKNNRYVGITKDDFPKLKEDVLFILSLLDGGMKEFKEFFIEHFQKGVSIRKYAEAHEMNRGSVEYLQKKLYAKLAGYLYERDLSDGKKRVRPELEEYDEEEYDSEDEDENEDEYI